MITRLLLAALMGCCMAPGLAAAGSCDRPSAITFGKGASTGQVEDQIARGEVACWTLGARAGQTLSVNTDGSDDAVVFQLYPPGWHVTHGGDGYDVTGRALPGAAPGQDTRRWSGRLPRTGRTLLVLGTTHGGAHAVVHVELR